MDRIVMDGIVLDGVACAGIAGGVRRTCGHRSSTSTVGRTDSVCATWSASGTVNG